VVPVNRIVRFTPPDPTVAVLVAAAGAAACSAALRTYARQSAKLKPLNKITAIRKYDPRRFGRFGGAGTASGTGIVRGGRVIWAGAPLMWDCIFRNLST
jgi:hypothetical protein